MFWQLLNNRVLIAALFAWGVAQLIKVPIEYWKARHWNFALIFSSGGMPSSHSALVCSTMLATGLYDGFNTSTFAATVALAMVVVYDAAGVRRQAGIHAQKINLLINELFSGQPISEERLKEVIGHKPREVIAGVILGLSTALIFWIIWP
jgi:acid phosphatase family membrane protein YuiD